MNTFIANTGYYNKQTTDIDSKSFKTWCNMINRVYSKSVISIRPTYQDCTVCDDWLNYNTFNTWFINNYKQGYQLDKDLKSKGKQKLYSPTTCIFIPKEINGFLTNNKSNKGALPTGISLYKGKFKVQLRKEGKQFCLGCFDDLEYAVIVYNQAKSEHYNKLCVKCNEPNLIQFNPFKE